MTEKKILKRSEKAVWEKVKATRADHSKLYSPSDIDASADLLAQHADELRALAKQMSSLNAMPPDAIPKKSAKAKRSRTSKRKS